MARIASHENAVAGFRRLPVHLAVPLLIGSSLCWFGASTIVRFEELLYPTASITHTTVLAMLCALAVGIRLPDLYARFFAELAGSRRREREARSLPEGGQSRSSMPDASAGHASDEASESHLKTIAAACLVAAGLFMLVGGALAESLAAAHQMMMETFHWTMTTARALDLLCLLLYVALPMILLGIAINAAQRAVLLHTHRSGIALASIAFGFATALLLWAPLSAMSPKIHAVLTALVLLTAGGLQGTFPARGPSTQRSADLPALSSRWQFVLAGMLALTGFLLVRYLGVWQAFEIGTVPSHEVPWHEMPWQGLPLLLLGVAVGLACSTRALFNLLIPLQRLAVMCFVLALSITVVTILVSRGMSAAPGLLAASDLPWAVIALPALLCGLTMGCAASAMVQGSPSPGAGANSAAAALCWGAALASATRLVDLPVRLSAYHVLVFVALCWMALGGLLLIYEPRFRFRRRRLQATIMVTSLAIMTFALPPEARRWSALLRRLPIACDRGQLLTIANPFEATRALRSDHWPADGNVSPERAFHRLRLVHEKYPAVILGLSCAPSQCMPAQLQDALVRIARDSLQPDGVFQTRFSDPATDQVAIRKWQERLRKTFDDVELENLSESRSGGWPLWCVNARLGTRSPHRNLSAVTR